MYDILLVVQTFTLVLPRLNLAFVEVTLRVVSIFARPLGLIDIYVLGEVLRNASRDMCIM